MTLANHASAAERLIKNIEKVIIGKRQVIELAVVSLLCRGHLLIEDFPGLGKTMLARALAKSVALDCKRLQCTPDLMPSDVTGVPIYNQHTEDFEFRQGPVFTNILLADELNRATPRAQSALLECMEESQVSVDTHTYRLPEIFMVVATQNPIEQVGTFLLPEAQLDRFFMRLSVGYPTGEQEAAIVMAQSNVHPISTLSAVVSEAELIAAREMVKNIHIEPEVVRYAAEIVRTTREHPDLRLGASPRGTLALTRAACGMALIRKQPFVTPALIKSLAHAVLTHRITLRPQALAHGKTANAILTEILNQVTPPV